MRSRCRTLSLAPLGDDNLRRLLLYHRPDLATDAVDHLIALADGSLGRALKLADSGGLDYATLAADILDELPRLSTARIFDIADAVLRGEGGFLTFIDLLRRALANAVRNAASGAPHPAGQRLAALRPLAAWSEAWQALGQLAAETEDFYMDKRQAIISALRLLA